MSEPREGPSGGRCDGCRHYHLHMVRSGEKPEYEGECLHPAVMERRPYLVPLLQSVSGRSIGESDQTPPWCPVVEQP